MMITDYGNAMIRNVVEPMKMITIWITSVFLYYVIDESIGENVGWFTFLEIIGFLLLTLGFVMYTRILKLPKVFTYPNTSTFKHDDEELSAGNILEEGIDKIDEETPIMETTEDQVNAEKPLLDSI